MATNLSIRNLVKARFSAAASQTENFSLGETTSESPNTSISSFTVGAVTEIDGTGSIQATTSEIYLLTFTDFGSNFTLLLENDDNFFWSGSGIGGSGDPVISTNHSLLTSTSDQIGDPNVVLEEPAGQKEFQNFSVDDSTVEWEFTPRLDISVYAEQDNEEVDYDISNVSGTVIYRLIGIDSSASETTLDSYNMPFTTDEVQIFPVQVLEYVGDTSLYETYRIQIDNDISSITVVTTDVAEIIQDYSWVTTARANDDTVTRTPDTAAGTPKLIDVISVSNGIATVSASEDIEEAYPIDNILYGRYQDEFNFDATNYGNLFSKIITVTDPPADEPPTTLGEVSTLALFYKEVGCEVDCSWSSVTDAEDYRLQRNIDGAGWTERYFGPLLQFDDNVAGLTGHGGGDLFIEYRVRAEADGLTSGPWRTEGIVLAGYGTGPCA